MRGKKSRETRNIGEISFHYKVQGYNLEAGTRREPRSNRGHIGRTVAGRGQDTLILKGKRAAQHVGEVYNPRERAANDGAAQYGMVARLGHQPGRDTGHPLREGSGGAREVSRLRR